MLPLVAREDSLERTARVVYESPIFCRFTLLSLLIGSSASSCAISGSNMDKRDGRLTEGRRSIDGKDEREQRQGERRKKEGRGEANEVGYFKYFAEKKQ